MEFLGFIRKGAAHIVYNIESDGKVYYRSGGPNDAKRTKDSMSEFCFKGYCLVVKGIIESAKHGNITLKGDKRSNYDRYTTSNAFSGIIEESKTKGSEVTLILRKEKSTTVCWDYISDDELSKLKITPLENLIKDQKKIQFLRAAGWGDARINAKLNQKK
jgi:hypothetical protein